MSGLNPTESIDISFSAYVKNRKALTEPHMEGGIPDYAYGSDYALRQKIKATPGIYKLAKAVASSWVPQQKHILNLNSLKVGPSQFPDVYKITEDCARILGIGMPSVFIVSNQEVNAYTIASDDDAPVVVIYSGLLERLTLGELKFIIGHECGHIHNNHGIFNTAAIIVLSTGFGMAGFIPGSELILALVSIPLQLSLSAWNRAAEVTSDRAGIICCDDPLDAMSGMAKLLYGAAFNREANIDAALKQYEMIKSTPVRFLELSSSHPVPVRRIFAMKEFLNSEVLYKWRQEWRKSEMKTIGKQELDMRCEKYIGVIKNKKGR